MAKFSYSITGDIQRHLPGRNFDEAVIGKSVTISDLQGFMQQVAADIDSRLESLGFTLPVTAADNPSGHCILAELNALGAAALAEETIATVKPKGTSDRADRLRAHYEQMWVDITNRTIDLIDVDGGPARPEDVADSGALDLDEAGLEREIFFEREMKW